MAVKTGNNSIRQWMNEWISRSVSQSVSQSINQSGFYSGLSARLCAPGRRSWTELARGNGLVQLTLWNNNERIMTDGIEISTSANAGFSTTVTSMKEFSHTATTTDSRKWHHNNVLVLLLQLSIAVALMSQFSWRHSYRAWRGEKSQISRWKANGVCMHSFIKIR